LEDNYSGPLHSLEYEEEKEKIKVWIFLS
jgi:hypothetical protein